MPDAIAFDHLGIDARDPAASAAALATVLGAPPPTPDGADDDMFRVDLAHGAFVLFAAPAAGTVRPVHVAFRVDRARFAAAIARLRGGAIAFGNDPEAPANGRTDDPLGGRGRVYFTDPDGHLFEIVCADA